MSTNTKYYRISKKSESKYSNGFALSVILVKHLKNIEHNRITFTG